MIEEVLNDGDGVMFVDIPAFCYKDLQWHLERKGNYIC